MVTTTIMTVLAFLLLAISGVSKAVQDKVNFHFSESIFVKLNGQFWNPVYSHMNKWKDGIKKHGEKFFGSSTFFVAFTDAWHQFQLYRDITFATAFFLLGMYSTWYIAIGGYVFSRIIFQIFFKNIFSKK